MTTSEKGALIVFTGPSGVGKGTILRTLRAMGHEFFLSVSATTRAPRPDETDGVQYHFLDRSAFLEMLRQDSFLEYAEYADNLYGTPAAPVDEAIANGIDAILEIEVQGAFQVRRKRPEAVLIFLEPPSMEELERRLRGRGTETEEKIQKRLAAAREECERAGEFDYRLVNDEPERCAGELAEIIRASHHKEDRPITTGKEV